MKGLFNRLRIKNDKAQEGSCLLIIVIVIGFILLMSTINPSGQIKNSQEGEGGSSTIQPQKIRYCPDMTLNANVSFDGSQFTITNNDSFDWNNVKIEVNSKYKYQSKYLLGAGKTYTIGAMQFADNGGNRFNPFAQKAQEFYIRAYAPDDTGCFWRGDF